MDHATTPSFSDAYDAAKAALIAKGTAPDDELLVKQLAAILASDGPSPSAAPSLDRLRVRAAAGEKDEGGNLLKVAGQALDSTTTIEGPVVEKVAGLKLLRHLYLGNLRGGQQLWIASLPKAYTSWPHKELRAGTPQLAGIRTKASEQDERFSEDDRKNLGSAAVEALKWSMAAQMKTASVAAGTDGDGKGTELVRRWFCDDASTDEDVKKMAGQLNTGFKKIANATNSGRLIFTDHVAYRGTSFENSEAFVTNGAKRDRFGVVYIESAFFGVNNVLTGLLNWARIVVHELSHYEVRTVDVPGHYAWQGIKPGSSFPAAQAITNAENWAFFAADAANALPEDKRTEALQ